MNEYKIINGRIILKDSVLDNHTLVVKENIIVDITEKTGAYTKLKAIDANQNYVSPGFVELHIHGCGEYGFETIERQKWNNITKFLQSKGINTYVPTFLYDREVIKKATEEISKSDFLRKFIPGIYIEGPFINKEKCGGISQDQIKKYDRNLLKQIIKDTNGLLKFMTIAPELEGANEIILFLIENNIIPCLGHSVCEIENIPMSVIDKINITHLFNAMSGISHKKSGLAMLPFIDKRVFFEVNGDAVHLNKETIKMCYENLNRQKMILISDAAISAGLNFGEYESYGKEIVSNENGLRYKKNGVLIGSNLLVNQILKRFIKITGAPLYEAVKFISYNPCSILGIEGKKGSIEIGKEADIILLDNDYNVIGNIYSGN